MCIKCIIFLAISVIGLDTQVSELKRKAIKLGTSRIKCEVVLIMSVNTNVKSVI